MRRLWVICLAWAGACGGAPPDAPVWEPGPVAPLELRASLSAEEVALLGEVTLYLDLYRQADLDLEFQPAIPDGFSGERDPPLIQPFHEGFWERHALHLRPLRKGSLVYLPRYRQRVLVHKVDRSKREVSCKLGSMKIRVAFEEVTPYESL